MKKSKTIDATILTVAVLGSLILVNVIGVGLFHRFDLTRDKEFTLSQATTDTLKALRDPVTIQAYFTKDLPPPYSAHARFVKDLLEEFYAQSGGNLRFEFIDPTSEETTEDKDKKKEVAVDFFGRPVREETSVEKELRALGIQPIRVQVNEADKVEVKLAYMGISIRSGDKKEVIPVVSSTQGLEYDLTTMVRKVTREKQPKIAFVTGKGGPDPFKEMQNLYGMLGQMYEVAILDFSQKAEIPEDVSAILVVGPASSFSEAEQQTIDKFVRSGRSAAFLLGSVKPELSSMSASPIEHGLAQLMASYGVQMDSGLVLDTECATINVSQQRGYMRISQPAPYPFIAQPKALDSEHPLTRGLAGVTFPFMAPLSLVAQDAGATLKTEVLAKSSNEAWIQSAPHNLDPFQFQNLKRSDLQNQGEKNLLVAVSGVLPPAKPAGEASQDPQTAAPSAPARILVAGGYGFVLDEFMTRANQALALNLFDWLVQDEAMLAVRTRGLSASPLEETSEGLRQGLKYGNIVGLPLLFVLFGLVRWRMRESRRKTAAI